jgi:hypothetical protein
MNTHDRLSIFDWAKENKLTRQKVQVVMLEAWRRSHMFHKGNCRANLMVLALPSEVKGMSEFLVPSDGRVIPRHHNWYKLTLKGQQVINNLSSKIDFSEKRHNQLIFEM